MQEIQADSFASINTFASKDVFKRGNLIFKDKHKVVDSAGFPHCYIDYSVLMYRDNI